MNAGESSWNALMAGNGRYTAGAPVRATARPGLVEHRPMAAALACSDARAVPEDVFDADPGQLFTVRSAGHTIDTGVIGSLEYAVSALRVPLLVILGHTHCGAVSAAHDALTAGWLPPGQLGEVIRRLLPEGTEPGITVSDLSERHILSCLAQLLQRSEVVAAATRAGKLTICAAQLRLEDGSVRVLA